MTAYLIPVDPKDTELISVKTWSQSEFSVLLKDTFIKIDAQLYWDLNRG